MAPRLKACENFPPDNAVRTSIVTCSSCGGSNYRTEVETRDYAYESCGNIFEYVRCLDCNHIYLRNRPLPTELETIYPETYFAHNIREQMPHGLSKIRDFVQWKKFRALRAYLKPGDVILEVGCGSGDLLQILKRYGDPRWSVVGVEPAPKAAALLRAKGIEVLQQRFEDLRANDLNLGGKPVGAVIMNQVIEHLEDPTAVVKKAFEILRPGGALFIETPSLDGWDTKFSKLEYWGGWHSPRHFHIFREETLQSLMHAQGFSVKAIKYIFSPYMWSHTLRFSFRHKYRWERISRFFSVGNPLCLILTCLVDLFQLAARGKTSNMRIIALKEDARPT